MDACAFRLTDQSKWKAMSPDAIASINTPGHVLTTPIMPHLMGNTLDSVALSNDIEKQIRALIIQHRKVEIQAGEYLIKNVYLGFGLYDTI